MRVANEATKEKFLIASVAELEEHGVTDFSIRRVAQRCEVSCGAPYKHFKNKNELILEVIRYINRQWYAYQTSLIADCTTTREELIETSMGYIGFLCDHPSFLSILLLNDKTMDPEQIAEKNMISNRTAALIENYCQEVSMGQDVAIRKIYAVRSFIFGAALMINGEVLPKDETTMANIRYCITREFDLS